jgi:glucan endo-1,3-alpha-glucosidase
MTITSCTSYCSGLGYLYAGVEYGMQCYCGNTYDTTKAISSSSCNMACAGDSSNICGGNYAINIYQVKASGTTSSSSSTTASATSSASASATSLGCYTDSSTRLLNGVAVDSSSLTPSQCQTYCANAGYTYAGVEYSIQVSESYVPHQSSC